VAEDDDAEGDADCDDRNAAANDKQLRPGHEEEGPAQASHSEQRGGSRTSAHPAKRWLETARTARPETRPASSRDIPEHWPRPDSLFLVSGLASPAQPYCLRVHSLRLQLIVTWATFVFALLPLCAIACVSTNNVSDGSIQAHLPEGWQGSVAPGVQSGHRVAWVLIADFPPAAHAAAQEGGPNVPKHKVLVAIGDFVPVGIAANWSRVNRVVLPHLPGRRLSWNVRFAHRALRLTVSFGSPPTIHARRAVEQVLASIRHT
jgi:hypothetical protein